MEDADWIDDDTLEDDDPDDESDDDTGEESTSTDGLLGLGPHPAGWLRQLSFFGILSEYVIAICLEPVLGHMNPGPGSSVLEHVGFISLGDSMFTRQAASTAWTATIPPETSKPEYVLYSKVQSRYNMQKIIALMRLEVHYRFPWRTFYDHKTEIRALLGSSKFMENP